MEEFEELKQKLEKRVQYNQIPQDVTNTIQLMYMQMIEMYKDYGIGATMQQHIDGELVQFENWIEHSHKDRIELQMTELRKILDEMKKRIENEQYSEHEIQENVQAKERKEQNSDTEKIMHIDMHTTEMTSKITAMLEDSLNAIRNTGNRVMSNRGFSDARIQQVNDMVRIQTKELLNRNDSKIYENLKAGDAQIINGLLKDYEEYIDCKRMTEHQKFAKTYRADEVTIGKTETVAKEIKEAQRNTPAKEKEDNSFERLPDNII